MITTSVFKRKGKQHYHKDIRPCHVIIIPRLKDIQINQHITRHLPKAYSFGNLALDQ